MKILYVTTISDTMVFFPDHINMLIDCGHSVDLACNVTEPINQQLIDRGCKVFNIEFQRSPFKKQNWTALIRLKKLLQDEKYELIHTHTPIASFIVRLVCRNMKNVKVIYTAHGFHFFNGAPLKNWLIYYPIERWLARYTDVLVTINIEDYERAKRSFKAGRVEYIPGVGLDTKKFSEVVVNRYSKRIEIGATEKDFILLSVGELNKNKNHEVIIKAIAKLNNLNIYYVICGQGPLENYLSDLIKRLGMDKRVKLLGYRSDIAEICKVVDIFVFPSFREGLSVALMEAMASGLPVLCSDIRGNNDLIENGKGGYLVKANDVGGYAKAIEKVAKSGGLSMGQINAFNIKLFDKENVKNEMLKLYNKLI